MIDVWKHRRVSVNHRHLGHSGDVISTRGMLSALTGLRRIGGELLGDMAPDKMGVETQRATMANGLVWSTMLMLVLVECPGSIFFILRFRDFDL